MTHNRYRGVQLNMVRANDNIKDQELNEKLKQLMPDRSVTFKIPNTGSYVIRVLQEDKPDILKEAQNHPDEDKLICLLKISHNKLMREILTTQLSHQDLEFYSGVYTYGFLTSKNRVEILGMRCDVRQTDTEIFQLKYYLEHLGKFNIVQGEPLYHLCGFVMAIFATCARQQEKIGKFLKTYPKSDENNILTTDKLKKKQSIFELSDEIRITYTRSRYVVGKVDTVQIFKGKSIARVKLLESPSKYVYIKHCLQTPDIIPHSLVFPCVIHVKASAFYVEMSFEGQCLTDVSVDFEKAVKMIVQLLVEMEKIHMFKYIHNDVKRSNIVIYNDYTKFIDFELAKKFDFYDRENQICELFGDKVYSKAGMFS